MIDAPGWFGFYAPAGTPGDVLARLEKEIIAATAAPETQAKILGMGYQPTATSSAQLRDIQREDFERWGRLVKASGFQAGQ